jgi:CRP-like cAMP-binding protein
MAPKRLNCWEYKKCGRETGGENSKALGICPAAIDTSFDGINSGICGGRFCWAVAGTFCGGEAQGTFAEKRESCLSCDFFRRVRAEEGTANLRTKFLKFIFLDEFKPLIEGISYKHVKGGERFITQGEEGEYAYIIQRGSCIVIVEKNGEPHPIDHRSEGDIVGITSVLTGEPRRAHVEAETDMELWCFNKTQLENISEKDLELLSFLTEIVADRFDSKRPTADRMIGKYLATDIIGRGSSSIVYKGVHTGLKIPVIIKMMRHDMAMDPYFIASFKNEAITIATLNHENIIKIYDIEECFKTIFIIMQYLEGRTLREVLNSNGKLSPPTALRYILQTCRGLKYAHDRGIIHQDINPGNLFILPDDTLKIIDFGFACSRGAENFLTGTPYYMAPEQVECLPVDERTDIYCLGITAFELVTGKRPYPDKDGWTVMEMHVNQDIQDPADYEPNVPEALRQFIIKACTRDPNHRFQTVGEALQFLNTETVETHPRPKMLLAEDRKKAIFVLSFEERHQGKLQRLVEEFNDKAKKLGAVLKPADF